MAHCLDDLHPFALDTATPHYAADRPVAALHLALEVDLDFATRALKGTVAHTLEAVRRVRQVTFDAQEMELTSARVDGAEVAFDHDGKQVHVYLTRALEPGTRFTVRLGYRTTPRRGLYFIGPDAHFPERPLQAWTQGQDEDSRFWFPCLDTPAQKCPSEVAATFPADMTMLSNGALVSDKTSGQRRTMRFRLAHPHSPYLVTLVVGQFDELVQPAGATRVRTLFAKGRKDDALRCVARTPKMVALFEQLTGRAYPWGDYAQVFVSEFIFGGMENTGATTLTDAVLHDARAHLDYSAEFLIAHELAHQWFGDLLTCREWPHGWLNEGFATYAEVLWKEESEGVDEADLTRAGDLDAYLAEVSERYARPIVARKFDAPIDLFDRHLYEKGGLVLHELRCRLGDDDFHAVVRAYVKLHEHGAVETIDLSRTVERVTGRNFDRFFDEYVHRAGHPALKVVAAWDPDQRAVRLAVTQTQAEPHHLPLPVRLESRGKVTERTFELTAKEHVFFLPCAHEPEQVVLDARRDLLATFEVEKPVAWWRHELAKAPHARARTDAAVALGKEGSAQSVAALRKALLKEKEFHGTRAACARALGAVRSPTARDALLAALEVKHPKARRAVVAALGAFKGEPEVEQALLARCLEGDPSIFVEGEAARALGRLKAGGAVTVLVKMLERPSFQDAIQTGALDGLAALRDPAGWKPVVDATRPAAPMFARRAAVAAVAALADVLGKKAEAVEVISDLLRDSQFRMRLAAIDAAAALGDERMIGPLTATPFLDGREQRAAREAVRTLRAKAPAKELAALREALDKLTGEVRGLKEKLGAPGAKKRRQVVQTRRGTSPRPT